MYNFSIEMQRGGQAVPLTRVIFEQVIDSQQVAMTCERIKELGMTLRNCKDEEQRKVVQGAISGLKKSLPGIAWHTAAFKGNKRSDFNVVAQSGLVMLDFDHIEPGIFEGAKERGIAMGMVAAHVTPSCAGLRVVCVKPENMTIAEAQEAIAERLGLKEWLDKSCKDLSRLSFVPPRGYWLYIDYEALWGDKKILPSEAWAHVRASDEEMRGISQGNDNHAEPQSTQSEVTPLVSGREGRTPSVSERDAQVRQEYEKEYEGVPYSSILVALEELYGGRENIVHGRRNNTIFAISCQLRALHDDPDWIASLLERCGNFYGEERSKAINTIKSACNIQRERPIMIPALLRQAIEMAKKGMELNANVEDANEELPAMPSELPRFLQLLVERVPDVTKPMVAQAVFPSLCTLVSQTDFRMCDNTLREPRMLQVTVAPQSSGKSAIKPVTALILSDIKREDDINRQKEQEYRDLVKGLRSTKDKPKRPELPIRIISSDCTHPALLRRIEDARGAYCFMQLNEVNLLEQLQTNGLRDVSHWLCLVWDGDWYGAERVGAESVTSRVQLRLNIQASTTPENAKAFFRRHINDGVLSRIDWSTIVNDERDFVYGDFTEEYAEELRPYIENLKKAKGLVECEEAMQVAKRLLRKYKELALQTEDPLYENAYRAVVNAHAKGVILWLANGCEWEDSIGEFMEYSCDCSLWTIERIFGDAIREAQAVTTLRKKRGPINMLEGLPNEFPRTMAEEMRRRAGLSIEGVGRQLRVWQYREYIVYDEATGMYRKTEKYRRG